MKSISELNALSNEMLRKELTATKSELSVVVQKVFAGNEKNISLLKKLKKNISRIMTILNNRMSNLKVVSGETKDE